MGGAGGLSISISASSWGLVGWKETKRLSMIALSADGPAH